MADQFHVVLATDWDPRVPGYRKRKVFSKTRAGCSNCKAKKVKCDESRPVCARCQRNGRCCEYTQSDIPQSSQVILKPRAAAQHISAGVSFSFLSSETPSPFPLLNSKNGTPMLHLMQYWHGHWEDILHVDFTDIFQSMFQSSNLVRNVVLGITASYLRHVSTSVHHQIAEHFYQSLAIQEYRNKLTSPVSKMSQPEFNELILGGMFLNILCYPLPLSTSQGGGGNGPATASQGIYSDTLGWLALQAGLRPLLRSGGPRLETAMNTLGPIFVGANESRRLAMEQGLKVVPRTWINFFDLGTSVNLPTKCAPDSDPGSNGKSSAVVLSTPMSEVFAAPMMLVAFLRQVEPIPVNAFHHFAFLAKAHSQFRDLLQRRDEKALWLYGYACGLMCRYKDLWWTQDRSWRDYNAVCRWLQKLDLSTRPGLDGMLWKYMMDELKLAPIW